jgi:hypothetical protein
MLELPVGTHSDETAVAHTAAPRRRCLQDAPERQAHPRAFTTALAALLDQIDHGMLLVAEDRHVLHANHAARAELDAEHPLQLLGCTLRSRSPRDVVPLHKALADACLRRRRRKIVLGEGEQRLCLAVVPIPMCLDSGIASALVMLGSRKIGEDPAVEAFARTHRS